MKQYIKDRHIVDSRQGQSPIQILHIDASSRGNDSVTRQLSRDFIENLRQRHGNVQVTYRDTTTGLPYIDADWVNANFTAEEQRDEQQQNSLAYSDTLIEEIQQADILVIGSPIYNFSVPASLKAWIDLVARAGVTFRYTTNGPEGLLSNKKAYVIVASGGTAIGSNIDFASGYLRHVLGFLGIKDLTIIPAERLNTGKQETLTQARQTINQSINDLTNTSDLATRFRLA